MSIQREIVLRYRSEGHVRFEVPAQLCRPAIAELLEAEMSVIDGVYRVEVNRRARKLSIRYQDTVCDFHSLARELYDIVGNLEKKAKSNPPVRRFKDRFKNMAPVRWTRDKIQEAKETVTAMGIVAKHGIKMPFASIENPEKVAIDFLNDVLVLYLIKLHWHRITQHWIPNPFRYRYQWLAVLYLIYLFVRSRRPGSK